MTEKFSERKKCIDVTAGNFLWAEKEKRKEFIMLARTIYDSGFNAGQKSLCPPCSEIKEQAQKEGFKAGQESIMIHRCQTANLESCICFQCGRNQGFKAGHSKAMTLIPYNVCRKCKDKKRKEIKKRKISKAIPLS